MDARPIPTTASPIEFDFSCRVRARREQTLRDLAALHCAISKWLEQKVEADTLLRHRTQLQAIETVLLGAAKVLSARGACANGQVGKSYDDCRQLAQATVWLERLWQFICSKFDQRSGETFTARMLQAADEVIWSCYHQVIKELPPGHPAKLRALMPLAHIEPEYSPAAVQFDQQVPPNLRLRSGSPTLDQCLDKVPLPTLRLPPWCVSAPWGLVLIGHEVGHHLLHELGIADEFAAQLGAVVRAAQLDDLSVTCWTAWSEEIFADAFSVFALGPAAVIAITELEWTENRNLALRKVHYPAPAIRLALMTRLAERAGLDTTACVPLQQLQTLVAGEAAAREDWRVLDPVVEFLSGPLPGGLPTLSSLCAFEAKPFAARGVIAQWAEGLRGIGSLDVKTDTEDARHMASAAVSAWLALLAEPDENVRRDQLTALVSAVPQAIRQCAEPVVRSGGKVEITPARVQELAAVLLEAPFSDHERVSG